MTSPLHDLIAKKGWVLADGALGTNYFQRGLETGDPPELWCVDKPDEVLALHQAFIDAGADIILTNSFGGTSYRLKLHQADDQVEMLNKAAARLARQSADAADRQVLVGGSIGPTGELFNPLGALDRQSAIEAFTEQAEALRDGGADLLWIETMSSAEEMEAAVFAARASGLPVCATMTFDTAGRTMMGITPQDFANQAAELSLDGFGANCGIGPAELLDTITHFNGPYEDRFIIAKGNCGIPQYKDGEIHYHGSPDLMADYALMARDAGATIIGGCCGTTPAHLRAMYDKLSQSPKQAFDAEKAETLLGAAWSNLPDTPADSSARRGRRRRK